MESVRILHQVGAPNKRPHTNRHPTLWLPVRRIYRTLDWLPAPASGGGR